jgi:hypothetical protein
MIVVRKQGKRNKIAGIDIKYREKIAFCILYIPSCCLFYRIKNTNRFCFYFLFAFSLFQKFKFEGCALII